MNMLNKVLLAIHLLSCLLICRVLSISEDEINGGFIDIVLTPEQQASVEALKNEADPHAAQFAVVRGQQPLWPNGRVPYILDSSLGSTARSAILQAMSDYTRQTCIAFAVRSNEADYVRFFRGNGCFSYIGRTGGPQDISIGQGCERKGIVIHEIFHALGRWHEQSRPDRDVFVRINEDNIQQGVESNFDIVSRAFVTTQGVPYDTSSIMHYGAYAFSRNGQPTIEPVDRSIALGQLGQRSGFSAMDLQHVNALYCGDDNGADASWSSWGAWSTCSRTCNGGQRTRVRTCVGGSTCQGSNIDTERCGNTACPTPSSWSSWSSWGMCSSSCGGGRQQRARRCVNGDNCVGRSAEFRDCNSQSCPQPTSWSGWSSWSSCSATCQGGVRTRRRTCQNGNTCPGSSVVLEFCNSNVACVQRPLPTTGEWSAWSECTKECGGGWRFRSRQCGRQDCESQQQPCNTQDCNPEPELRGLQHAGCFYVNRFSRALGLLEKLTSDLSDDPTTRTNPVRKCAVAAQQYSYQLFAISIGYCISGSNRLRDYQYVSSEACKDGVGAFVSGYFIMDVYQIVNPQTFQDSVSAISSTTMSTSAAPLVNSTSDSVQGSGSPISATSSVFTLCVTLLVLTFSLINIV